MTIGVGNYRCVTITFNSAGKKKQFSPENGSDERFRRRNSFLHSAGKRTDVSGIERSVSFPPAPPVQLRRLLART
jgi:hypothetical protein